MLTQEDIKSVMCKECFERNKEIVQHMLIKQEETLKYLLESINKENNRIHEKLVDMERVIHKLKDCCNKY